MVNLISSLLEELPLAVGSEEIARVPSTLRDQSDQVAAEESHQRQVAPEESHQGQEAAEESHQRHIKSLQVGRELSF